MPGTGPFFDRSNAAVTSLVLSFLNNNGEYWARRICTPLEIKNFSISSIDFALLCMTDDRKLVNSSAMRNFSKTNVPPQTSVTSFTIL